MTLCQRKYYEGGGRWWLWRWRIKELCARADGRKREMTLSLHARPTTI